MPVDGLESGKTALQCASVMLAATVKMLPAVMYHRLRTGDIWEYTFAGDRFAEFFGSAQADVFDSRQGVDFEFVHRDDRSAVEQSYNEIACNGGGTWSSDFRIVSRAGATKWIRAFAQIEAKGEGEIQSVMMLVDVSRDALETQRLRQSSDYDALTGLYSRSHFERAVADAARRQEGGARPFGIVVFDIDDFHEINEAHGFDAGDQLLRAVGEAATALGRGAIISRLEADKFGALTDALAVDDVIAFAKGLLQLFKRPFEIDRQLMWLSASAGITFAAGQRRKATDLLREAESALQRARESGAGTSRLYSPEVNDALLINFALKENLYAATAKEQFELHYQPKIDLASGRVVGAEALIRWNHPELGLQSPARFIPIAERTGLILPIGAWVIRQACRQYLEWCRAGIEVVPIAVNVSAVQFARSNMFATISQILAELHVRPEALEIEITEGMLIDCSDELIDQLQKIRTLGVGIALDDFGTGFSSLAYLQRLPLSILKVDQTFVRGALKNKRDAAIVRSVVHLAKQLELRTVAEGIETTEQLAFVRDAGCEEGQGYLFSPPLFSADFAWFVGRKDLLIP